MVFFATIFCLFVITPWTESFSTRISKTSSSKISMLVFDKIFCIACLYKNLSHWTLSAWTASPFLVFSVLYWIPDMSVATAMMPPKASISLTICDLPRPPIAGLQDICPILLFSKVTRAHLSPNLNTAWAASTPACPPPTTITS